MHSHGAKRFLSAERAYEYVGFVLKNRTLGTYVRDIQIFEAFGESGWSWICFEGQEFKWLKKEYEREVKWLMRGVCASRFWNEQVSAGEGAGHGSHVAKRRKVVDERVPEVMRHEVVERRVAKWIGDLKRGKARAYYAFLLLLTPYSQGWQVKEVDVKRRVENEVPDYVKMVYQVAARQQQEDTPTKQDMTPFELFSHERRTKTDITLPRLTTTKEGYHTRSEPAIMTWPADPKRWTSPRWRKYLWGGRRRLVRQDS